MPNHAAFAGQAFSRGIGVRPGLAFALAIAVTATFATRVQAAGSSITPGVGIANVKLGMTLAQVEKALGKDHLDGEKGTVGGVHFREITWRFGTWSVVFLQKARTYRVIQVWTTLASKGTAAGIGVGSSFKAVVRTYPHVACGMYYTTFGSSYLHSEANALVLGVGDGPKTAFLVEPVNKADYNGAWRVYGVLVTALVRGHNSFKGLCKPGWRQRGTPATFP